MNRKGPTTIVILLIVAGVLVIGVGVYFYSYQNRTPIVVLSVPSYGTSIFHSKESAPIEATTTLLFVASSTFEVPYPLSWTESSSSIRFDLIGISVETLANKNYGNSVTSTILLRLRVSNQTGKPIFPVPIYLGLILDESGNISYPLNLSTFELSAISIEPYGAINHDIVFAIPTDKRNNFVFATRGTSNIFFSVDINNNGTECIQREPFSETIIVPRICAKSSVYSIVPVIDQIGTLSSLSHPNGIGVSPSRGIYVADDNGVEVFDQNFKFIKTIGSPKGSGPGQFSYTEDVAFDASGNMFATDSRRVKKFDPSGNYLTQFGTPDTAAYKGIAVNNDDLVYVTGSVVGEHNVDVFSDDGTKIDILHLSEAYRPTRIAIDKNNRIYISNVGNVSLTPPDIHYIYDNNSSIGIYSPMGVLINKIPLNYVPDFLDIDDLGRIWVADPTNGKIWVYTTAGAFIKNFQLPFSSANIGSSVPLNSYNPTGIEVSGNRLYASISYSDIVRVYSIQTCNDNDCYY